MQNLQTQILLPLNSPRKNLEIIHGRKLISLFTAISIFLTSMEEVILLGLRPPERENKRNQPH